MPQTTSVKANATCGTKNGAGNETKWKEPTKFIATFSKNRKPNLIQSRRTKFQDETYISR